MEGELLNSGECVRTYLTSFWIEMLGKEGGSVEKSKVTASGWEEGNYHNCQQYRRSDDPPVIHVYILLPAPGRKTKVVRGKDRWETSGYSRCTFYHTFLQLLRDWRPNGDTQHRRGFFFKALHNNTSRLAFKFPPTDAAGPQRLYNKVWALTVIIKYLKSFFPTRLLFWHSFYIWRPVAARVKTLICSLVQ